MCGGLGLVVAAIMFFSWRKSDSQLKRILAWVAGIWGAVSILFYLFAILFSSTQTIEGDLNDSGPQDLDIYGLQTQAHEVFGADLSLKVTSCSEDTSGYATIVGTVKNEGTVTVEFVEVKVTLMSNGTVVDTDSTYAVGNEGLEPNEQSTFEWLFSNPPEFDQCGASILEFDVR